MTDYSELKRLAAAHAQKDIVDPIESKRVMLVEPETVLALITENESLKGPHDWLAEDLIKELVDNAQAIQENADDGEEDPFVIVLLAAAQRIRRQEANIEKLKADVSLSAKTADCWDRLNIKNKALSDSFRAERDQLKAENEIFEEGMRSLASTLGAGGYNAETLTATQLVEKVQWGVDHLAETSGRQIDELRAEIAGLKTGYEAYERVNAELKAEVDVFRGLLREMRAIGNHAPAELTLRIEAAMGKGEQS